MTVWGIDLGVRSVTLVGLRADVDGSPYMFYAATWGSKPPKSVRNAPPETRWNELVSIRSFIDVYIRRDDVLYVEEPPLAGRRDVRTALRLAQVAGAVVATSSAPTFLVEVSTWKKEVVGRGNADKAQVAEWLATNHPNWSRLCDGDQNKVDALCIALYGLRPGGALAGGLDPLREAVGAGG